MTRRYALGIDIGGTKVAGGLVDESGTITTRTRRDTPDRSKSPKIVEDTIVEVVDELLASDEAASGEVTSIGVGAAGFVSADLGTVVFAPHLSWRDEPLRDNLTRRLHLPIFVDNDANCACWAEYRFGAARGESHVVMITLGTGIGGGLLVDGRIIRGRYGVTGEYGHMQVVPGGQRCECGNRGCWEQYASGNALVREARSIVLGNGPMGADLAARVGGNYEELTGPVITQAAQEGDATAVELITEIGEWLGVGIANLAAALDPGMFVVGGGVSAAGDLLLEPARESFRKHLTGRGYRPEAAIVEAALGNDAGLIGAADQSRSAADQSRSAAGT